MLISIASSAQSSDTSYWKVPTWKARELMKIALQAKACDTLVNQQAIEINKGLKYEASQDSLLVIRSRENAIYKIENKDWTDRFNNQVSLTKIEKRKKRRWVGISLFVLALGVITNLK